jgi:hypothetical protein
MLSKAANERSQKWDKKVSSGKLKREESKSEQDNKFEYVDNMNNPETLRVIQKTKELETKIEQVSPSTFIYDFNDILYAIAAVNGIQPFQTAYVLHRKRGCRIRGRRTGE